MRIMKNSKSLILLAGFAGAGLSAAPSASFAADKNQACVETLWPAATEKTGKTCTTDGRAD
ncbi:MAG TPA: hypothetical protein VK193_03915, partial [Methyloceanibacter sp.]|nr:hypothetical protein [Methyloceanibacter sp.]